MRILDRHIKKLENLGYIYIYFNTIEYCFYNFSTSYRLLFVSYEIERNDLNKDLLIYNIQDIDDVISLLESGNVDFNDIKKQSIDDVYDLSLGLGDYVFKGALFPFMTGIKCNVKDMTLYRQKYGKMILGDSYKKIQDIIVSETESLYSEESQSFDIVDVDYNILKFVLHKLLILKPDEISVANDSIEITPHCYTYDEFTYDLIIRVIRHFSNSYKRIGNTLMFKKL